MLLADYLLGNIINDRLEKLIEKGERFNFANNSHHTSHEVYSKASD